jgi:hypothetical protein
MKKDTQLYEQKVSEMLAVYRKVAPDCFSQKQALERVVRHPASRFYIQAHTAYNKLRHVFNGYSTELMADKECDKRMYEEIYKRVLELANNPENYGMSLNKLCEIVVEQPAPEFYMSPSTFRLLLSRERPKIRERLRQMRHATD